MPIKKSVTKLPPHKVGGMPPIKITRPPKKFKS